MSRNRNQKRHTGRNVTLGAAAVLLVLAGGMYGLGGGKGLLPGKGDSVLPESSASAADSAPADPAPLHVLVEEAEAEQEAEQRALEIIVSESRILYNGVEVTLAELEDRLLNDFDDSAELKLLDDHAIKAEYDEVAALLERLGIRAEEG